VILDSGKAEANLEGFPPVGYHCHGPTGNGHDAAIKALLDSGKVEAGSRDINGRTLAVVGPRRMGTRLSTRVDSKDGNNGQALLLSVAENGQEAVGRARYRR